MMNENRAFPSETSDGMSLRDWYAGMAMQALVSKYGCASNSNKEAVAPESFEIADLMLKERELWTTQN